MKKHIFLPLFLATAMLFTACETTPSESSATASTTSVEESQETSSQIEESSSDSSTTEENEEKETMLEQTQTLIKYPEIPKDKLPRDYDYTVRIIQGDNSIELPVYNPVYASDYFTRTVNNWDMHRRYAEFAFTGEPVKVEITVNRNFDRYTIMPSSKAIPSEIKENVITYTLTEPCTTVLKLNNDKDTHLTIFAEAPETKRPKKDAEKVVYFEAGYHEVEGGVLTVESDTTVYLEPGALVKARVIVKGENVKISGRGAFIESNPTRGNVDKAAYMCTVTNSNNVVLEDVRFLEAHCFNVVVQSSNNVEIENLKLLSNQVSTDGLSVFSQADGLHVNNCYFNVSDNVFVIGGAVITNFLVENCIVMTDYAFLFPQEKLGGDPIVFKNIDVLRYATFMKHQYPRVLDNPKPVNLVLENCTAIDSDGAASTLTITFGADAVKNFTLKNVSFPPLTNTSSKYINTHDSEKNYKGEDVDNVTVTFDNVWVNGEYFTEKELAKKDTLDYSKNNKTVFTDTKDESAVCLKRNDVILPAEVRVYNTYIADRRIESEHQPYTKDGKTYVSAYEILEAMRFENVKVENGKLTFSYKTQTYEIEVADEKAMVDVDTLAKTIKTDVELVGKTIRFANIERDDNLLRDPDFEGGLSMNWVTRNFTKLYISDDAQSGSKALRIGAHTWGNDGGVCQDIAQIVRQYGKGEYRLTAWVKKASKDCDSTYIRIGVITEWSMSNYGQLELTDEWQKIEYTYKYTGKPADIKGLLLVIGQCDGKTRDVLVENVSMTWVG